MAETHSLSSFVEITDNQQTKQQTDMAEKISLPEVITNFYPSQGIWTPTTSD